VQVLHWCDADTVALEQLLSLNTVTPMEGEASAGLWDAQNLFARLAANLGFEIVHFQPPSSDLLADPDIPVMVRERAAVVGATFLELQPNLVLRLGPPRPESQTILFNFHMDTVSGDVPISIDSDRITGRGSADAKGLGIALLVGIRTALAAHPDLTNRISILVQSVGGEEGGAMGLYGTRSLVAGGYVGRLNIVCEPTSFSWLDRTTSSMTARVEVNGAGSTDDEPTTGHNATILLAHITQHFAKFLSPGIEAIGGKICIAGVNTGTTHNRVFGTGQLLINFAYPSLAAGRSIEELCEIAFRQAILTFGNEYSDLEIAKATAKAAGSICTITWLKRGLPVLANRDQTMEEVLHRAGLCRHTEYSDLTAFTCDAMWFQDPKRFTIVYGPGHLGTNGAHGPNEFMSFADLDRYAHDIASIITEFGVRS
jgi:acetylornithine deacetylase/succinyl-diaminopimelate desuccinylase-like protein